MTVEYATTLLLHRFSEESHAEVDRSNLLAFRFPTHLKLLPRNATMAQPDHLTTLPTKLLTKVIKEVLRKQEPKSIFTDHTVLPGIRSGNESGQRRQ